MGKKWKAKKLKKTSIIPQDIKQKSLIPFEDKTDEYSEQINKKIVFVFKDYLHSHCWLCNITQTKNLIDKLSHTSTIKRSEMRNNPFIKRVIPCENNNEYKSIFCNKFEQYESDFYEIICSDTNRVFWYFINNIFHIVLIKDRHLEIDKK